jgi:hypothetical protein
MKHFEIRNATQRIQSVLRIQIRMDVHLLRPLDPDSASECGTGFLNISTKVKFNTISEVINDKIKFFSMFFPHHYLHTIACKWLK